MTRHPRPNPTILACAAALLTFVVLAPQAARAAEACTPTGDPYTVVKSEKVEAGETVFKMADGSYCHGTTRYKRRDIRAVPRNDGIARRDCGTQVAEAKNYAGGAGRGNGCS